MRKAKWGRVVCVTSIYGKEGGGRPWFNMAKAAQTSLMKTLALTPYLARDGLTFNSVAPGGIAIPGTGYDKEQAENPKAYAEKMDRDYPLGRLGTPDEVAATIAFLCSEAASLINGANIVADGGQSRSF
jgi:3-oxoacyl-[acyl-carrier protein] reductase